MWKCTYTLILVLLFTLGLSAQAQNQSEKLWLDALCDTEWQGTGKLMGRPAVFKMKWKKHWEGKFYSLAFENKMNEVENGMAARAFYQWDDSGKINGQWFDSRGKQLELAGHLHENELLVYWKEKGGEQGKSHYRYQPEDDTWVVQDYIKIKKAYQLFAEASYRRK